MRARLNLNRRQFVAGSVAAAAGTALDASPLSGTLPDLVVCDRHCATQLRADEQLRDIAWYRGDVTVLWNTRLKPLWQGGGGATVTGISRAPALFCLEQLARRQRHAMVQHHPIPGTDAVRWVIAPVTSRGWI